MKLGVFVGAAVAALVLAACSPAEAPPEASVQPEQEAPTDRSALALSAKSASEIAEAIVAGETTSEALVEIYLNRIDEIDRAGPRLQSVLSINPNALEVARALDAELAETGPRGPLHGVPVLLKDNIETADPLATTAGAMALKDNVTGRDAPSAAGLRASGAVILGKTNLSEWANFRSTSSISGWSALGGQVRNPHILDRSPCGSSSGSGAAIAASLAAAAVGTETNGSIICPSAMNGVVGFKPTVGLVDQARIIPISSTQDTAGPMTKTVRDAAIMLTAMATGEGATDFAAALSEDALSGKTIGVLRFAEGENEAISALFGAALEELEAGGAILVKIDTFEPPDGFWGDAFKVLKVEFKATLNTYLADAAERVTTRSLAEVIAYNSAVGGRELELFDQDILEMSEAESGLDDADFLAARARVLSATRENGIDTLLAEYDIDFLVAPSEEPAFLVDAVSGDPSGAGVGAGWMAAIAGYPHLTVPMGAVRSLPVGLSFIGAKGDDAAILAVGYAYEARTNARVTPAFLASAEAVPVIADAMKRP